MSLENPISSPNHQKMMSLENSISSPNHQKMMSVISRKCLTELDGMILLLAWKCPKEVTDEWTCNINNHKYHMVKNGNNIELYDEFYDMLSKKTIPEIKQIILHSSITPPYSYTLYNFLVNLETAQNQQLLIDKINENNDLYNQINDKLVMFIGLLDIKKQNDDNAK